MVFILRIYLPIQNSFHDLRARCGSARGPGREVWGQSADPVKRAKEESRRPFDPDRDMDIRRPGARDRSRSAAAEDNWGHVEV